MPVVEFPLTGRRPVSDVAIGTPLRRNQQTGQDELIAYQPPFSALWDTGAAHTFVVPRVVSRAGLHQRGFVMTAGIDGIVSRRPVYPASLVMNATATNLAIHFTDVVKLERDDQLGGIDMLVGMDIIATGETRIAKKRRRQSLVHLHNGNMINERRTVV